MKNDRGARSKFMGSGAAAGGVGGSKFSATMFGQTLLNKMGQKENTSTSQMF